MAQQLRSRHRNSVTLRATLRALLVVVATPLRAQEQKQTEVALALVLAVDASGSVSAMIVSNCRSRATQRHSEIGSS